jgi:hypothetical protein
MENQTLPRSRAGAWECKKLVYRLKFGFQIANIALKKIFKTILDNHKTSTYGLNEDSNFSVSPVGVSAAMPWLA